MASDGLNLKESQIQYAFEYNSVLEWSFPPWWDTDYTDTGTHTYMHGKSDNIYMLCLR